MRMAVARVVAGAAGAAPADDLLALIPANAKIALAVGNPAALCAKLEKLAADSGAPPPPAPLLDKLKEILPEGLIDLNGPAAAAVFEFGPNASVLIFTAADPKDPLGKVAGKDAGDGVKEIEHQGETLFLMAKGGRVIGSQRAELLATFRKGGKSLADAQSLEAAGAANGADAFVLMNLPESAADLNAQLDGLVKTLESAGAAVPKATIDQYRTLMSGFARVVGDADFAYAALNVDKSGAALRTFIDFKPDSGIGAMLAKDFATPATEPWMGIPDHPYMAAGFIDFGRLKSAMLAMGRMNDLQLRALKPEIADKALAASTLMINSVRGTSALMTVEKGKFAQFQRSALASGADGKALLEAGSSSVSSSIAAAAGGEQMPGLKIDMKTEAETIGGVAFTRLDMTFDGMPEPAGALIAKLAGKPLSIRTGMAPDGTLVGLTNLDPTAWLKNDTKLTDNAVAKAALAKLGERPLGVALIDPYGVMELVKEAIPFPLPEHLTKRPNPPVPPLGFSALATKRGVELRMRYETATGRALAGKAEQ